QEILAEERSGRQEEEVVAGLRRRVASRKEMTEARAQRNTDEFEKACREEVCRKEEICLQQEKEILRLQEILAEERSGRQEDKLEGAAARGQRNTDEFEKACREEARWKEEVLQRQICNLKQELLEAERFARVEDIQTKGSQRKTDEFEKACRQEAEQGHLLALKPHAAHLRAGVEAGEMVVEVHEAHIMWRGR
ncbi:unnamed protein product, partial [Durusdinium trenchii]